MAGGNLDADRPSFGGHPELADEGLHIILRFNSGKTGRSDHILTHWLVPDTADFLRHLFTGQVAAHAGFGALPDFDFNSVRITEIFRGYAVEVSYIFKDIFVRCLHFLRQDSAFSGAHGAVGHGGAPGQGDLGLSGKRAEGHMGDINRIFQNERPGGMRADHGGGAHFGVLI